MSWSAWKHPFLNVSAALAIVFAAAALAPTDLIDSRGAVLRGIVGSYGGPGSLEVRVHWTRDGTVSPPVIECDSGSPVGGPALVHLAFHRPSGLAAARLVELKIEEDAGHTSPIVIGPSNFDIHTPYIPAHVECGDPDPADPLSPPMLYYDHFWPTSVGHNGDHTITATIEYTVWTGWDPVNNVYIEETNEVTETITVDVQNLLITGTSPANPEPVLWDPDTMADVELTADVHACYKANQQVTLWIYNVEQGVVRTVVDEMALGGGTTTISYEWNGLPDQYGMGSNEPMEKGLYLFKWQVGDPTGVTLYGDHDRDKSDWLQFASHSVHGHTFVIDDIDPSTFDATTYTDFRLNETSNIAPTELQAKIYDPDFSVLDTQTGTLALGDHTIGFAPVQMGKSGKYVALKNGKDNRANSHKGHKKRPALQIGKNYGMIPATSFGSTLTGSAARGWGAIDTTTEAQAVWNRLRRLDPPGQYGGAGYNNGTVRGGYLEDPTVSLASQALTTVAVFSYIGHGGSTLLHLQNGDLDVALVDALPADEFDQLRFANLAGCNTGSKPGGLRCISDAVLGRGADSVLGYAATILTGSWCHQWHQLLFDELRTGSTVDAAVAQAKMDLETAIGTASYTSSGYNAATRFGNGSETIVPPAFGN